MCAASSLLQTARIHEDSRLMLKAGDWLLVLHRLPTRLEPHFQVSKHMRVSPRWTLPSEFIAMISSLRGVSCTQEVAMGPLAMPVMTCAGSAHLIRGLFPVLV